MSFFEIRKYSGRNFNLVQENHFFARITGIIESKALTSRTKHAFFVITIIHIEYHFIENKISFFLGDYTISLGQLTSLCVKRISVLQKMIGKSNSLK